MILAPNQTICIHGAERDREREREKEREGGEGKTESFGAIYPLIKHTEMLACICVKVVCLD